MRLNRPEAWLTIQNKRLYILKGSDELCTDLSPYETFRAHEDGAHKGSRPTSKDRSMLIRCYASRDQIRSDSYHGGNHALIRPPQNTVAPIAWEPPGVLNTNICCGFFRTGFRPSDRRQNIWISVTSSGNKYANNFMGDLTGCPRHWGQSRSSQEKACQKSFTTNRVIITIGHAQGTVRS
jgi:hypothetical protein